MAVDRYKGLLSPLREKSLILAVGYVAVALFFGALVVIRALWAEIPWTSALLLAAIFASPLPLSMFWGQIASIKFPYLEVTLRDFSVYVDQVIAAKIQDQHGSHSGEIVESIASIFEESDVELIEVNLRDGQYWWPTRIYLVAALVDDYTSIRMIVFVHGYPERKFIGMATPLAVRKAFANHFLTVDYELKYSRANADQRKLPWGDEPLKGTISGICNTWEEVFMREGKEEQETFSKKVDRYLLQVYLNKDLDDSYICWDGQVTRLLQYQILNRKADYTPLVQNGHLKEIAGQRQLAMRVAESVLKKQIG
jgi:hypothetical protein